MDRNNIIGFALIFLVLMAWSYFNSKQTQQKQAEQKFQDSIAYVKFVEDSIRKSKIVPLDTTTNTLSVEPSHTASLYNTDSLVKPGVYSIENEVIKLDFTNYGGHITKAELKNYFKMEEASKGADTKSPVILHQNDKNEWNLSLDFKGGKINTKDILFTTTQNGKGSISFKANTPDGKTIIQSYSLVGESYNIEYSIQLPGSATSLTKPVLGFEWLNVVESQEKNPDYEKTLTTAHYKPLNDDPDHLGWGKSDEEKLDQPVKWVANSQQFFNSNIVAEDRLENVHIQSTPYGEKNKLLAEFNTRADIPIKNESANLKIYIGPNEFSTLKAQGNQLENIISFGASILGTINKYVIRPVFNFLSNFFSNKGIVILLLTLIVKLLLFPLSYKMLHSQAKMGALKPEMAHLKEKFKDDPQQMQMESMKIYREFGVNPLGGCMPMLLQMPIWLALYQFFPASIEFRQSGFLWANDLSSYDVFTKLPFAIPFYGNHVSLFTLIWVISTLVFTYYSTKDQDFSMNPAMKYMQYLMPLFFLFFFNNSAAGLTAYMSFSNILNIAQTLGGKALLFPESKMKLELHAAKSKPKKKGGFQERLESMMKEQQSKMESRQKQIKK